MTEYQKIATIKVLDEIKFAVIGLRQEELNLLYEQYGYYEKGYQYNPLFKLKKWDGKKHFFTKGGLTFNHLMPEIVASLKHMGYKFKFIDQRHAGLFEIPFIDANYFPGITLGKHQLEEMHAIAEKGNGIILAGTGAGKTLLTAVLCDLLTKTNGAKNIVIVPNKDLIEQTIDELAIYGLSLGEYSGKRKMLDADTVVSTWQAIQHNKGILGQFNSLIVDECHGVTGEQLQDILGNAASHISFRIALTGTLHEDPVDRMTMRVYLGDVLHTITARELIDSGWLAELSIKMWCLAETLTTEYAEYLKSPKYVEYLRDKSNPKMTMKRFMKVYLPDYETEKDFLAKRVLRNEFLADFMYGISQKPKGNTLVILKGVEHGKKLASMIEGAIFIYGEDKAKVRKKIYAAFADNDNMVVIATFKLVSTGLSIKRLFNVVMIDAEKSFTRIIQTLGRSLRKAHDKGEVTVYDIHSNMPFSRDHANKRKKFYDSEQHPFSEKTIEYEELYKEID
jgi:superfamily II DNA or RNA helicase